MGSIGCSSGASRLKRFKRRVMDSLFCARSIPRAPVEMGELPDEPLTRSFENLIGQHTSSTSSSETGLNGSSSESEGLSGSSNGTLEDMSVDLSKNGELGARHVNVNDCPQEAHVDGPWLREQSSTAPVSMDTAAGNLVDEEPEHVNSNRESAADDSMVSGPADSLSVIPGPIGTSQQPPGSLLSNEEQEPRAASVYIVDVVSIHSNILSSSIAEISNREAGRNSRRMFWDAFSRSRFRRNRDSPTIFFTTGHADDLGSHDRWLLDFSGNLHYDGVRRESRYAGARNNHRRERQWQTRYETPERFHDVSDDPVWETSLCSTGLHLRGTCSCESLFGTEESDSRTGISQVILLADALFEVLEEIHRHRMSLSPSTLSLPAPESVVDSFPIKNHKKSDKTENGTCDVQQCHICLVEYEEGDEIRVLPCSHEYHMSCVDKWLKEIHGVCPLCRDDVCKGAVEGSASIPEIPSL